jgi:hypothetical protein
MSGNSNEYHPSDIFNNKVSNSSSNSLNFASNALTSGNNTINFSNNPFDNLSVYNQIGHPPGKMIKPDLKDINTKKGT